MRPKNSRLKAVAEEELEVEGVEIPLMTPLRTLTEPHVRVMLTCFRIVLPDEGPAQTETLQGLVQYRRRFDTLQARLCPKRINSLQP